MTAFGPQTVGAALLLRGTTKYRKYASVRRAVDRVLAAVGLS